MRHDIIVLGAGSAGLNIAGFMNKAGFKVLLIDKSDESIGGDCLNYGCVPSKALIHMAKQGKTLARALKYVRDKKEVFRQRENAGYFRQQGMEVELGRARFTGKRAIEVNGRQYSAKKIVIATGSVPRKLDIPGIEKIPYLTNESIFDLRKLPRRLLVIGGGPIGLELGQAMLMLGSDVTVIQKGASLLPKEDPVIVEILKAELEKQGMKFILNGKPISFTKTSAKVKTGTGTMELAFDNLLVSVGRDVATAGLGLETAGIQTENNKILVDKYLRTTNKNVYVAGDVAGSYQFTHTAELHAAVIIRNMLSPFKKKVNYDNMSWVTYTTPEIATFGLSERQLDERKVKYDAVDQDFTEDDRAIIDNYSGKLRLYIGKNKILGGTMIAPNAGELIQELALAQSAGINIKKLFNKTYPYPTATRINKKAISGYMAGRLTNKAKKLLRIMYRIIP